MDVSTFELESEITEKNTIRKSIKFHQLLRYDVGPLKRSPQAMILIIASKMKITDKIAST
jgi:hypothetical protein